MFSFKNVRKRITHYSFSQGSAVVPDKWLWRTDERRWSRKCLVWRHKKISFLGVSWVSSPTSPLILLYQTYLYNVTHDTFRCPKNGYSCEFNTWFSNVLLYTAAYFWHVPLKIIQNRNMLTQLAATALYF